jgi:signal transduction histidine kinase
MRFLDAMPRSRFLRYGLAVVLVASGGLVRWGLVPVLGRGTPAAIVAVPALLATQYCGLGPGILAAALSAASAQYWFSMPAGSSRPAFAITLNLLAFALEGLAAVALTAPIRSSQLRAQAAAQRMGAIYNLSVALGEAATTVEVAHAILHEGVATLGVDGASIYVASETSEGPLRRIGFIARDPRIAELLQQTFEEIRMDSGFPVAAAARTKEMVSASNARDAVAQFPALRELVDRGLPPDFLCVPMLIGMRLVGVLVVSRESPRGFSADERRATLGIAQDCGTAIDRAQVLERERSARIAAQAAVRAKDEFLVAVSESLNAPMPSILKGTEALRNRNHSHKGLGFRHGDGLDMIECGVHSASQLVESLIDLSRIVAHELRTDMKPVDLGRLVRSCTDDLRENAATRGVALAAQLNAGATVSGDVDRLRQAIHHLVANAIHFTPPGGHVRVEVDAGNRTAVVRVNDDGKGIPREELSHVFEAFRRGEELGGGKGLGIHLAIAKHVADAHQGAIRLDSEGQGRGTTATLELPLARRDVGEPTLA